MSTAKIIAKLVESGHEDLAEELLGTASAPADVAIAGNPAESAFEQELKDWCISQLEPELRKMDKVFMGMKKGKWPEKRMEHGVTRYRPMSQTQEDFMDDVIGYFTSWRQGVRSALNKL
jgi:hypothetical protein